MNTFKKQHENYMKTEPHKALLGRTELAKRKVLSVSCW